MGFIEVPIKVMTEEAGKLAELGIETEEIELMEIVINTDRIDYLLTNEEGFTNIFVNGEMFATAWTMQQTLQAIK